MMRGSAEKRKHGEMLPSTSFTVRRIVVKPIILISLLENPNGVCFENVYVY